VRSGETVVDLGSGAGRETLLAAAEAGPAGRGIGIDMTPEMIFRARENARKTGVDNAEFRLGEIEHLPLADGEADVVISNCVINLVPDKSAAFREAFRILRRGGRLIVSDIVSNGQLPEQIRASMEAWAGCIAGAMDLEEYLAVIRAAGFADVEVIDPAGRSALPVFSATIRASKPA
jgi:ubiquinone/menaquinone biosynthesis C-methylase UbiE